MIYKNWNCENLKLLRSENKKKFEISLKIPCKIAITKDAGELIIGKIDIFKLNFV